MAEPKSKSTTATGRRRMSSQLRRDIIRRVEDGEKANELAWELGFSSAAVWRLMRNHRKRGEAAFLGKGGREIIVEEAAEKDLIDPPQRMDDKFIAYLRKTLPKFSPDEMGIAKGYTKPGMWSAPEVKALLKREFGVEPSHDECARVQHLIGLRSHVRQPSQFKEWRADLTDEFLEWQISPDAKVLAKREKAEIGTHSPDHRGAAPRGRVFNKDRPWRNSLKKYILEDPTLGAARAEALAKVLLEIEQNEKA